MTTDAHRSVFEQLDLPDTSLARHTYAYAAQATPAFVHHHSVRSFVFARAHARNQGLRAGTDYDDGLPFVSCVLHDIGLSEEGNGDQRFEVDGADIAAAFLRERGVEERRIAVAWDAIALHTSDGIASRKGTEVALTQAGIGTDILGAQRERAMPCPLSPLAGLAAAAVGDPCAECGSECRLPRRRGCVEVVRHRGRLAE
jgi:hypothetical protein